MTDDSYFLQFLRARKFNNLKAYELYENYFTHIRTNPHWHADDENIIEKVMKTFDRGIIYPLSQRDAEGRKVVLFHVGKLDTSIDTPESLFSVNAEIYTQLIEDEDTQLSGFVSIVDFTGFNLKQMWSFSVADSRVIAEVTVKSSPARFKCIYIVNLPSFARILADVFKMTLSEKLQKRLFFPKDMDELKSKYIDIKLLPKELGGTIPEAEMIKEFKETIRQNKKKRQQIYDTEFDPNMIIRKRHEESGTGSFRKLEID